MTSPQGDPWTPSRELLAAYADGELDRRPHQAPVRRQIEAWLARHPVEAAALETQMELSRLWSATTPAEPSPVVWARVWEKIERTPLRTQPKRWPAALWLVGLAALGTAAALFIGLTPDLYRQPDPTTPQVREAPLHRSPRRPDIHADLPETIAEMPAAPTKSGRHERPVFVTVPQEQPAPAMKPLEVATSDEVEILSIAGGDMGTLVVGKLPVSGPLVLLTAQEVDFKPLQNGQVGTEMRMVGSSPMVWTPLSSGREE